ncbi:antigen peptide transporter 1 isoform X1 [Electrophorus electricus]|uniref:Transporter 1, ATP-binding cassette, sub-family B (MDR/TAP) n=3 Tax=Electrophorus electricus TaxID=8005 RepID=A0A4W4E419_ELEEL|nr:antigen peptide transporter 1 isoform X1 [Electrophorus electricus]XP_026868100.2 antigen peptide transporter 1 isoform X1 [Electrophorus electricus]XP_026868101.2 antigen peptide transporter 1 isoform X1 [Electrophorus electricus]XP_026868102.2 antigen peptide transporter 1 isoform X1 [Electrophorus electricus]XP_026868103.2 antigen peptide transporter 1 isoform X1 [Electrophorus electricus]
MKAAMAMCVFACLFLCVDVCVVLSLGVARLLVQHAFVTMWVGGLLRWGLLLLVTCYYPDSPAWMRSFEGFQTVTVHCLLYPAYGTLLWACGRSTVELFWGWQTWQGLLQGYAVMALSLLLWTRYVRSIFSKASAPARTKGQGSIQRLLSYVTPFRYRFIAIIFLVFISSLGEMAIPYYTGKITDWIMKEDEPEAFSNAIKIMSILTIMSAVFEFLCDLIYNITMSLIHTSIQKQVFECVLKQEVAFFDHTSTGEIVSRITTDTNTMSESLSEELNILIWYSMRLLFLYGFMLLLSVRLSIFTVLGLPIIWIIPEFSGRFLQGHSVKVQDSLAKANKVATETFSCMKTVKSFANEDGETERYRMHLEATYALNKVEAAAYTASTWTNSMSNLALKVSILYYGGQLVAGRDVSSGDLVAFVLYELQFSSALEALISYYPHVKKAIGASEKIFEYVDRKPDIPPEGTLAPDALEGHVRFNNVTFAYPSRPGENILKGACLELKPGKITALVGPSDGGKSTIVRLLDRFYHPQSGEILLDGKPLQSYREQYLHEKISVVAQEPMLFARSITENIRYGKEDVTDEEVEAAAKLAHAHKFISDFPKGYDTDTGEKGSKVSGGQRQRIAIARALIRRPQILVLDDATSDLDTESEHMVYQALLRDSSRRTVLLITHRASGAQIAEHVLFLRAGEVVEQGTHDDLVRKNGAYAEFLRQQNTTFHRYTDAEAADLPLA